MTPRHEDDLELRRIIAELQAGRQVEASSRRLFELYYPRARHFFRKRGYSTQDSEDLAQETLTRVFQQIASYRGEGSLSSWVFAVAANLYRNDHRHRHREKRDGVEVPIDAPADADYPSHEPVTPEISPDQEAFEKERREALARAVKTLPPQMKQVLTLRVDQDLKYREIAAVLQISIETVKAHLFQARQRLRAELGEDYGEWGD